MRIDAVRNETDQNDFLAYHALLQSLKGHKSGKRPFDADEEDKKRNVGTTPQTANDNFNTLEFAHKPECPLHELEEFEAAS